MINAAKREVIVASADPELRLRVRLGLDRLQWHVYEASGGAEAWNLLDEKAPQVLIVDNWLPDLEVTSFKTHLCRLYPNLKMVEVGPPAKAPESTPGRAELLSLLRSYSGSESVRKIALTTSTHKKEEAQISQVSSRSQIDDVPATGGDLGLPNSEMLPGMVGTSAAMHELVHLIQLVAPHSSRVLIEGETGTGKELVARALHTLSGRADKPMVTLNCAAIPEALLESELFGYARGAFTGAAQSRVGRIEAAHGGTLFLDEVGELSLALQAKLLRFLENGELQRIGENEVKSVDVRVLAATHRNLDRQVEEGLFRLDLLHRLSVFPIVVPALRDRKADIPLLAAHLLIRSGKALSIGSDAMSILLNHSWPGNVRELAHVLERAIILSSGRSELQASDIKIRRAIRN